MYPFYEASISDIRLIDKEPGHTAPHLHRAMEFVYVTKGSLELGMGRELYHMEEGDLGVVFPDMIHHYQVFSKEQGRAFYVIANPGVYGAFGEELLKYVPENPVLRKEKVPGEAVNAMMCLKGAEEPEPVSGQAYVQILLAKCIPLLRLTERSMQGSGDIVEQSVAYVSAHFREPLSLSGMALEIGVSKYVLSRVFSGVFHTNFNRYVNEIRLSYACDLLEYTKRSITEIYLDAGFESQRTFNRVFREVYRVTPREYRIRQREKLLGRKG